MPLAAPADRVTPRAPVTPDEGARPADRAGRAPAGLVARPRDGLTVALLAAARVVAGRPRADHAATKTGTAVRLAVAGMMTTAATTATEIGTATEVPPE